jgi:pyruvate, water dikinase
MTPVCWFRKLGLTDIAEVGGKNANLGEMLRHLAPLGVHVRDGFALTADAFRRQLREVRLDGEFYAALDPLDVRDVAAGAYRPGVLASPGAIDSISVTPDAPAAVVKALA